MYDYYSYLSGISINAHPSVSVKILIIIINPSTCVCVCVLGWGELLCNPTTEIPSSTLGPTLSVCIKLSVNCWIYKRTNYYFSSNKYETCKLIINIKTNTSLLTHNSIPYNISHISTTQNSTFTYNYTKTHST
jgi:hypothetical protein